MVGSDVIYFFIKKNLYFLQIQYYHKMIKTSLKFYLNKQFYCLVIQFLVYDVFPNIEE